MASLTAPVRCRQASCPVADTGRCLEGLDPTVCPHLEKTQEPETPESQAAAAAAYSGEPGDVADDFVALPHGAELNFEEAAELARSMPTRVVVLAGMEESGKTTLLTSLYEQFRAGTVGGLSFAGSATLRAFEQRCHLGRIASGRATPSTERTRQTRPQFLNIVVRPPESARKVNLLFTDVSGEAFRLARDVEDECRKLNILSRADHLALLVDGERIVHHRSRAAAVSDPRGFLKRAIGTGMVGPRTMVELVISKLDAIEVAATRDEALHYVSSAVDRLKAEFGASLGSLVSVQIAARPTQADLPFGFGIDDLLNRWVHQSRRFKVDETQPAQRKPLSPYESFRES